MPMKNPPHPGRSIRSACLEPLGLSITEGAGILGVTRQALNNVITSKSGISPEMAIRLTKAFGSTEETWLRTQLAYASRQPGRTRVKSEYAVSASRKNCTCIDAGRPGDPLARIPGALLFVSQSVGFATQPLRVHTRRGGARSASHRQFSRHR